MCRSRAAHHRLQPSTDAAERAAKAARAVGIAARDGVRAIANARWTAAGLTAGEIAAAEAAYAAANGLERYTVRAAAESWWAHAKASYAAAGR